jgi:transposase
MNIERNDARKVDQKTLQFLRNRAIKLRESGHSNKETATILGVAPETTSRWYSAYKKNGKKAIVVKKTGRPKNTGKTLSDKQEQRIIRQLIDTTPQQLKFKFALWTREAVKQLIKHELDIDMPISTVGHYLKKWEFTSKKPIKRAYERKDEKTQKWLITPLKNKLNNQAA